MRHITWLAAGAISLLLTTPALADTPFFMEFMEGEWEGIIRNRVAPDAEWGESDTEVEISLELDALVQLWHVEEGSTEFQPNGMEGFGMLSYDWASESYMLAWTDSTLPTQLWGMGAADPDAEEMEMYTTMLDPESGEPISITWLFTATSDDTLEIDIWMDVPGAGEWQFVDNDYWRTDG